MSARLIRLVAEQLLVQIGPQHPPAPSGRSFPSKFHLLRATWKYGSPCGVIVISLESSESSVLARATLSDMCSRCEYVPEGFENLQMVGNTTDNSESVLSLSLASFEYDVTFKGFNGLPTQTRVLIAIETKST
jgi:hypothetical protein